MDTNEGKTNRTGGALVGSKIGFGAGGAVKRRGTSTRATHTVRTADGGTIAIAPYNRGKAIAIHCTECMGHETHPKECTSPLCALYPFRRRTLAAYHSGEQT